MELILHVSRDQVEDTALHEPKTGVLMEDKFCKVGDKISPYLTVYANFEDVIFSKSGAKGVHNVTGDIRQTISGEIIDGYFDYISGFKFVVDVGILLRVSVKSPHNLDKIKTSPNSFALVKVEESKEQLKEFTVSKGDYISFSGVIEAMRLDYWESAIVIIGQTGSIVSRRELSDRSLAIKVKYENKLLRKYKLDDYYSKFKHVQRFTDSISSIKINY